MKKPTRQPTLAHALILLALMILASFVIMIAGSLILRWVFNF